VRRSFRRLPYPLSTMTGIVEGCRLQWDWAPGATTSTCFVRSLRNKISFAGEVVEFDGGDNSTPARALTTLQDTGANPFASAAGDTSRPYFIYACRNQFWANPPTYGPVVLVESTVIPDSSTGHPLSALGGPRGVVPSEDAILIGMGWVRAETTDRVPVTQSEDGWFAANLQIGYVQVSGEGNVLLPCGPWSASDAARVQLVGYCNGTTPTGIELYYSGHYVGGLPFHRIDLPIGVAGQRIATGDITVPLAAASVSAGAGALLYCRPITGGDFFIGATAYHLTLPRVQFGGG
jgi:hypothetical protein